MSACEGEECHLDTLGHSPPSQRRSVAASPRGTSVSRARFRGGVFAFMFNYLPRYWALASRMCVLFPHRHPRMQIRCRAVISFTFSSHAGAEFFFPSTSYCVYWQINNKKHTGPPTSRIKNESCFVSAVNNAQGCAAVLVFSL